MNLKKESTIIILLNSHNSLLCSKSYPSTYKSVATTSKQRSISLYHRKPRLDTVQKSMDHGKPRFSEYIYITPPFLKLKLALFFHEDFLGYPIYRTLLSTTRTEIANQRLHVLTMAAWSSRPLPGLVGGSAVYREWLGILLRRGAWRIHPVQTLTWFYSPFLSSETASWGKGTYWTYFGEYGRHRAWRKQVLWAQRSHYVPGRHSSTQPGAKVCSAHVCGTWLFGGFKRKKSEPEKKGRRAQGWPRLRS